MLIQLGKCNSKKAIQVVRSFAAPARTKASETGSQSTTCARPRGRNGHGHPERLHFRRNKPCSKRQKILEAAGHIREQLQPHANDDPRPPQDAPSTPSNSPNYDDKHYYNHKYPFSVRHGKCSGASHEHEPPPETPTYHQAQVNALLSAQSTKTL